jgi:hypothetical protein
MALPRSRAHICQLLVPQGQQVDQLPYSVGDAAEVGRQVQACGGAVHRAKGGGVGSKERPAVEEGYQSDRVVTDGDNMERVSAF